MRFFAVLNPVFCVWSVAMVLWGSSDCHAAVGSARPNILLIYTDDQSYRTLSCYNVDGAWPWVQTPAIDRLAREGVRFSTCYGAAWCTPSRASLLTGRFQHGIQGVKISAVLQGKYDPEVCRFWPAQLRQQGYETAMIGKWHLGHDAGHGRDWDRSVVWDQADIVGDWYNNQLLSIDGAPKKKVPGYSTDVYTSHAVDYVRREHTKPWCLWLCYNAPHLPNTVHPRHQQLYQDAPVTVPQEVFGPREGRPSWQRSYSQWKQGVGGLPTYSGKGLPEIVRAYNRLVSAVDDGVEKILVALTETKQLENTMIIFTSDQGFAWGEHGFAWKVGPYDACLRAPLLVSWPGKAKAGGVCPHPVNIVDVAATVIAAADVQVPWKLHGHNLLPLLNNPTLPWDKPTLMEHCRWEFGDQTDGRNGRPDLRGVPWWVFVRQKQFKYIRTLENDEIEELYDLEADPHELKNLAVEANQEKRLTAFRDLLANELRRTEATMVDLLPPPKPATR